MFALIHSSAEPLIYGLIIFLGLFSMWYKLSHGKFLSLVIEVSVFVLVFKLHGGTMNGGFAATVAALLATRQRFASTDTPIWTGNILDGQVAGFPAHTSTLIPAGTMLFGDFSEVVQAEWGVLEIDVNPYANFQAGTIGIRAFSYVDVGVRTAGAFSAASSIT